MDITWYSNGLDQDIVSREDIEHIPATIEYADLVRDKENRGLVLELIARGGPENSRYFVRMPDNGDKLDFLYKTLSRRRYQQKMPPRAQSAPVESLEGIQVVVYREYKDGYLPAGKTLGIGLPKEEVVHE